MKMLNVLDRIQNLQKQNEKHWKEKPKGWLKYLQKSQFQKERFATDTEIILSDR